MAMSKDLRVILVKLADRLHNMRTIKHMRPKSRCKKRARRWISLPRLPGGMGMQWMRDELEDLAFQRPEPRWVANHHAALYQLCKKNRGDVIEQITAEMKSVLTA